MPPPPSDASTPDRGRALFRVVYPAADRPRFLLEDGTVGRVVDCSELGLRYRMAGTDRPPAFGAVVAGEVEFRTEALAPVSGRVIRVVDREVALYLSTPGLSLRIILAEQRALRARYPFHDAEPTQ
jgi:hypothetical protein